MSNSKMELYADMLEKAKRETLVVADNVPEDIRLKQPAPGKATPLWLLGHMGMALNGILLQWVLGEESVFTRKQSLCFTPEFLGGTPPSTDPSQYPEWDALMALYEETITKGIAGLRTRDDAMLPEPVQGAVPEEMREFFSNNAATLNQMVSHDAYHRGQMAYISKL